MYIKRLPIPSKQITSLDQIEYYLTQGYFCQACLTGSFIQVHRLKNSVVCYTKQGRLYKRLNNELISSLMEYMQAGDVLEGILNVNQIYINDFLQNANSNLGRLTWIDRLDYLQAIDNKCLITLPLHTSLDQILKLMLNEMVKGIVLINTSENKIVRCNKNEALRNENLKEWNKRRI